MKLKSLTLDDLEDYYCNKNSVGSSSAYSLATAKLSCLLSACFYVVLQPSAAEYNNDVLLIKKLQYFQLAVRSSVSSSVCLVHQ